MTELTGLTVWGETVKKVKTVRTKNYMPVLPLLPLLPVQKLCLVLKYVDTKKGVIMDKRLKKFTTTSVNKFSATVNSFRKV